MAKSRERFMRRIGGFQFGEGPELAPHRLLAISARTFNDDERQVYFPPLSGTILGRIIDWLTMNFIDVCKDVQVWLEAVLLAVETPDDHWISHIGIVELCLSEIENSDYNDLSETRIALIKNLDAMIEAFQQKDRLAAFQLCEKACSWLSAAAIATAT